MDREDPASAEPSGAAEPARLVAAWRAARGFVAARAAGTHHDGDLGANLSPGQPLGAWVLALSSFVAVYFAVFTWVHVVADTRVCQFRLDDPLFDVIPLDRRWFFVTRTLYIWLTLGSLFALAVQALLGDHRPLVRWGLALTFMALMRSCTILLVPLCRANVEPGTIACPYGQLDFLHLFGLEIPWRPFARNDLLFSGHVGELILLLRATRSWPRPWRAILWLWQIVQIYALLAVRGHYTVDILLAIPCAICADLVAVRTMRALRRRPATVV